MRQQPQKDNQAYKDNQLPRRTSRGVRAEQTEEEKKQDDQVYRNLFGDMNDSDDEEDESFAEQIGLNPLQSFSANFSNYNYGRGYHYFFNLDTFPRVPGSPSYALDDKNRFKYTYSHDQEQLNGTPITQLINRKYVGLPTIDTTIGKSKNQDKNVCHYHLFNTEDKKYYNHRLIAKYKYILKHLIQLVKSGKLQEYTQLTKDCVMHEVCEPDTAFEKRKEILEGRIKVLEERVSNMSPHLAWKDGIYFHFALDQRFHNEALAKGQNLSQRNLKERIFNKILSIKYEIQSVEEGSVTLGAQKPKKAIQKWLLFQEQNFNVLSQPMRARLQSSQKLIEMFRKKEELIIFPSFIFNFGNAQRAVDSLMKAKLQKEYESGFYIYKAFIKKLFKRDLSCQQQALEEPISAEEYAKTMKQKLSEIETFYKEQDKTEQKRVFLDGIVQLGSIEKSPLQQKVHLFHPGTKTEITLKQLMLLYFYRNISIALTQFIDYINADPQIIKLMSDPNYQKYHYGISKIVYQQEFCILINDLTRFADMLSNTRIESDFDETLFFGFSEMMRVGYVWCEKVSDQWETEKDEEDVDVEGDDNSMRDVFDNGDPQPSKKVKNN